MLHPVRCSCILSASRRQEFVDDIASEVRSINPSLSEAIAHDIAHGGDAEVEQIDVANGNSDASDAAHLILIASLLTTPSAIWTTRVPTRRLPPTSRSSDLNLAINSQTERLPSLQSFSEARDDIALFSLYNPPPNISHVKIHPCGAAMLFRSVDWWRESFRPDHHGCGARYCDRQYRGGREWGQDHRLQCGYRRQQQHLQRPQWPLQLPVSAYWHIHRNGDRVRLRYHVGFSIHAGNRSNCQGEREVTGGSGQYHHKRGQRTEPHPEHGERHSRINHFVQHYLQYSAQWAEFFLSYTVPAGCGLCATFELQWHQRNGARHQCVRRRAFVQRQPPADQQLSYGWRRH